MAIKSSFTNSCIFRWDIAGQEAYEEARRVCYDGTHVLLIGFSVVEPDSLANVENLWAKEAKLEALRDAPVGQKVSSILLNLFESFLFSFIFRNTKYDTSHTNLEISKV